MLAFDARADHAGQGLKGNILQRTRDAIREPRKAARTVAAHFGFTAVAIVVAHPKIGAVCRPFDEQDAIGADATMPVTEPRDLFACELQITAPITDHDEAAAGAIHFREPQHVRRVAQHREKVTYAPR